MSKFNDRLRIRLLNIILNYIYARDWTNYDNFAEGLVDRILADFSEGNFDLHDILAKSPQTFFRLNSIQRKSFLSRELILRIRKSWETTLEVSPALVFSELFPEIRSIQDREVASFAAKLDIPESKIQAALRESLRARDASPISRRGKDSALEIADVEHFKMKIGGRTFTFVAIVKGYRSVGSSKISWKEISHQVTKAYSSTHPDYILLLSAREPTDGLITSITQFAQDVGNPNLTIFVPPLDLAKLLRTQHVI